MPRTQQQFTALPVDESVAGQFRDNDLKLALEFVVELAVLSQP